MRLAFITLFLVCMSSLVSGDIIMGVVPQQSPLKLLKVWSPIAKYLTKETGEKVVFKTEKSIPKFEEALYSGRYDFAYMNPYHYVVAHKKQNYLASIRSSKNIFGILVVQNTKDIKKMDLNNASYVFPAPNAFAATLLTKYDLVNEYGVDIRILDKSRYVNSHDSVYKTVSRGFGDIGGGIERTFNNMTNSALKESMSIAHKTKAYPSHPFAFKSSMNNQTKQKLTAALLNMPKNLLKSLSMKELIKIEHSEYDSVKELALKLKLIKE